MRLNYYLLVPFLLNMLINYCIFVEMKMPNKQLNSK